MSLIKLKQNQFIDFLELNPNKPKDSNDGTWNCAVIKSIDNKKQKCNVHYIGWEDTWNENVHLNDARIKLAGTYTIVQKCLIRVNAGSKKYYYWPCRVNLRVPFSQSMYSQEYLSREKKIFVTPYARSSLPWRYSSMFSIDDGNWFEVNDIVDSPKKVDESKEALKVAMKEYNEDESVSVLKRADFLKGSLLKFYASPSYLESINETSSIVASSKNKKTPSSVVASARSTSVSENSSRVSKRLSLKQSDGVEQTCNKDDLAGSSSREKRIRLDVNNREDEILAVENSSDRNFSDKDMSLQLSALKKGSRRSSKAGNSDHRVSFFEDAVVEEGSVKMVDVSEEKLRENTYLPHITGLLPAQGHINSAVPRSVTLDLSKELGDSIKGSVFAAFFSVEVFTQRTDAVVMKDFAMQPTTIVKPTSYRCVIPEVESDGMRFVVLLSLEEKMVDVIKNGDLSPIMRYLENRWKASCTSVNQLRPLFRKKESDDKENNNVAPSSTDGVELLTQISDEMFRFIAAPSSLTGNTYNGNSKSPIKQRKTVKLCSGTSATVSHAFRLTHGQEVKGGLEAAVTFLCKEKAATSMFVMTAVGSVKNPEIRLANAAEVRTWDEGQCFEVVSLTGTFSKNDCGCHLHISLADEAGNVFGGHLIRATVHTTLEVVLGSIPGVAFTRHVDEDTGYKELSVNYI